MSVSSCSNIVDGIKLSDVAKYVKQTEKFEKHDVKTGKPTGKFGTEEKHFIELITGEKIEMNLDSYSKKPRFYIDSIPGISDSGKKDVLSMYNCTYESYKPSDYIVGIQVVHSKYSETSVEEVDENLVLELKTLVSNLLKERFGYEGKIQIFLRHYFG